MRRRDVLIADIAICLALITAVALISLITGAFALIAIPTVFAARMVVQKLVYDRIKGLERETMRKTIFNLDPISFEILYWGMTAAAALTLWMMFAPLSIAVMILSLTVRILSEYLYFSDMPNRWYLFRFRLYNMRRKFHPSQAERLQKILVTEVDGMKGHDFEKYVADVLSMNGFRKIKVTRGSGDFGIDVTAYSDNEKYAFQCKRSSSKIGIKAVQEAFLGKEKYKADVAVVITNNYFTKQAFEAAEGKVALWDRERLGGLLRNARDSLSDEKYNEQMAASETEIRMFAALFDKGKGDARLTEKVMGTLYPSGNIRSEEDVNHFLRRVGEHIYSRDGISEVRLKRMRRALETDRTITPFEADIACYHLSETHTITFKEMSDARSTLAKAFIDTGE